MDTNTPTSTVDRRANGARAGRAGLAIVSRGLLFFAGLFMFFFGLMDKHVPGPDEPTGAAVKYLGPHGNAIGMMIMGAIFTLLAAYLLFRTIRYVRAAKAQGLM